MRQIMLSASDLGMAEENGELLLMAAVYDQVDFMNDLLMAEVHGSVDSTDRYGLTPLHHAACHGSHNCVKLLLQRGADPNACSHTEDNCNTPLHHAARIRNLNCIRLLVEYGGEIELRNVEGLTPMDILKGNGDARDCIAYLENVIETRRIEQEDARRQDLYDQVAAGNLEKVEEVLQSLENIEDAINRYYRGPNTLLYKASYEGYPEIVRLLLQNGANGKANGGSGLTPLYAACYVGNLEVIQILVESLPHLLMQPTVSDQSVPLHAAILRGNIETIRYILNLRKEVSSEELNSKPVRNTVSKKSSRGQDEAAKRSSRDTSILDVNFLNKEGISPLHLAVSMSNEQALLELLKCKPILKGQIQSPHPSCLAIDIAGSTGETPLLCAIKKRSVAIAKLLLDNGADPNRLDSVADAMTPLQAACKAKHQDMVELLLSHGSNPNFFALGKPETNPLYIACINNAQDVVKLLLKSGAKDIDDSACLEAISSNYDHIVNCFLEKGVFSETDDRPVEGTSFTPMRIIWSKRQLPEVREKWLIDAVVRQNVTISLQRNTRIEGIIDRSTACKLITQLDLSGNNLKVVPLLVFKLRSLRKLSLADNKIEELPMLQRPDANQSGDASNLKRNQDAQDIPKHPQDPAGDKENIGGSKMSSGVNGATHVNGGVKIRPSSAHFSERKPVSEKYQTSSSQSRPVSDIFPRSKESAADDKQDSRNGTGKTSEEIQDENDEMSTWDCPLLEELDVQKNRLTSVPKCLFELPSLKVLNLDDNEIKKLPFEFWSAPSLKDVFLRKNKISCLPSNPHLSRKQNGISRQSSKVEKDEIDGRRYATTNGVGFGTVRSKRPSWDGESSDDSDDEEDSKVKSGLFKLDISDNHTLNCLPIGMPCLAPNLSKLIAAGCAIEGRINLSQLPPELSMLDLSRNKIKQFNLTGNEPETNRSCFISTLARLKRSPTVPANINSKKQIKKFCHHRSHLRFPRLKTINLSDNSLEAFVFMRHNSSFDLIDCALPDLRTLTLSNNLLKEVPVHIGKIRSLLTLDVSGNPSIDKLPPELGLCAQLYDLKFNSAQIREPSKAIIEKKNKGQTDVPYIRNFLKGVYEQSKPYQTIKLMLVGHSGKGKSTLLENLRKEGTSSCQESGSTRKNSKGLSTVGVDVCDWTYQRRNLLGTAAGPEVKFSTWDFAGQEEYYATHTCFLSKRAIYLLVWKLTDGLRGIDQLAGWLHNIQSRAPDSSVIIVGTHYDEILPQNRPGVIKLYRDTIFSRFVSDRYGGGLQNNVEHGIPRVVEVVEVSSKARAEHNIRELRGIIHDKVLSIRDSGDGFLLQTLVPASYLELERAVLAKAKSFQEAKQYPVLNAKQFKTEMQTEMKANGFRELQDDEMENAVKFLHDCGILLHFDGPALEDLYFIDPQWLCDMLAHVVTIRDVNPFIKNGVLRVDELRSQIFKSARFSSGHVKKYVELMNKFEVALQISPHYLLVPSLLPQMQKEQARISDSLPGALRDCMSTNSYLKEKVFRRLYRMAYVPSGFWARLISRLIADTRIAKAVASCSEFASVERIEADVVDTLKESLKKAAPPEWDCWRTGIELSCFGVKILRVCELKPMRLFFGHNGSKKDAIYLGEERISYSNSHTRFIEIVVPNLCLQIAVDSNDAVDGKTGFRLANIDDSRPQKACELLVLVTEHIDNLMVDWFPALDVQNIHGQKAVHKISLCPDCVLENLNCQDNENITSDRQHVPSEAWTHSADLDSARNSDGDKVGKKVGRQEQGAKFTSKSMYDRNGNIVKGATLQRGRSAHANTTGKSKGNDSGKKGRSNSDKGYYSTGSSPSAGGSDAKEGGNLGEESEPSATTGEEDEDDQEGGNPSIEMDGIRGFTFKEAMEKIDADKTIECEKHGVIEFSRIFPDLVFVDLLEGFVFQPDKIEIEKFIAAGSYGAVFKAKLKRSDQMLEVAVKVPNNTDAAATQNPKAKQDAEEKRKLKEGMPTIFLSGIYTSLRQELAILIPLCHPNIVDLLGIGLSPRSLLVEFAPEGSLDTKLRAYKNTGRKLDPYTMQTTILQISSALEYLHRHGVIYRDLKSENVLVWSFPEPSQPSGAPVKLKLTDYGVSCVVSVGGVKGHLGTPGFIAPEILRFRGKECYTQKADSFSFGSFLYELITQELPFQKYGSTLADQFMMDKKRPKLFSRDKRIPIPILSLLYKCWEQDSTDRPSIADVNALARLPEFPRLFDDLECDENFDLRCALTAYKERTNSVPNSADAKNLIGSELWLFSNNGKQQTVRSGKSGEVTVMNYVDGKCNFRKVVHLPKKVHSACVVGSTVWVGMDTGEITVYCSMTYKPLGLGRALGTGSIISMLHSPACHCVLIGMTNDCVLSYSENLSAFIHTIPQKEACEIFGNIDYSIKELIAYKVHPGNSMYNPVHCMAAVPSRVRTEPEEDVITYYGSNGEPVACSSRERKSSFDEYMKEKSNANHVISYELWCGLDKGLISIFDLKELQKVDAMAAPGCDLNNPALRNVCVKCMETRRTFQSGGTVSAAPNCHEDEPASVWVVVYPGTIVYRWNVDQRTMEASFDTLSCSMDRQLNSIREVPKSFEARDAQVNVILVVENELYIGTSYGFMIICDSISMKPLRSIRCFSEQIGSIFPLQMTARNRALSPSLRDRLVLCSGRGCLDKWNKGRRRRSSDQRNCTILTWFSDHWES